MLIGIAAILMSIIYYNSFPLQFPGNLFHQIDTPFYKLDKFILSTKTGLLLSILPYVRSYILIVMFTAVKTYFVKYA